MAFTQPFLLQSRIPKPYQTLCYLLDIPLQPRHSSHIFLFFSNPWGEWACQACLIRLIPRAYWEEIKSYVIQGFFWGGGCFGSVFLERIESYWKYRYDPATSVPTTTQQSTRKSSVPVLFLVTSGNSTTSPMAGWALSSKAFLTHILFSSWLSRKLHIIVSLYLSP